MQRVYCGCERVGVAGGLLLALVGGDGGGGGERSRICIGES